MPLPLSSMPAFTCLPLSLKVTLPPTWGAEYPPYLFYSSDIKAKAKLPFPQRTSPSPTAIFLPLSVLYLVLVGRIKGNFCHLGAFLSHLLHRAVRLLDELEEG